MHAYLLQVISWLVGEKILAQEDLNKHSFSVRRELTVIQVLIFSVEESLSLDGKSFVTFYYFRKVLKNYLSARCRVSFVGGCGLDLGGLDLVVSTLWCRPCGVDLVVSALWSRPRWMRPRRSRWSRPLRSRWSRPLRSRPLRPRPSASFTAVCTYSALLALLSRFFFFFTSINIFCFQHRSPVVPRVTSHAQANNRPAHGPIGPRPMID
jgi:hypothetical protein